MSGNLTEVVTALTSTTVAAGGQFSFAARASNIGNQSTGAGSSSRIFLSVDPLIDPFDTVLQIQVVPTLAAFSEYIQNYAVTLPSNLAPGTYYVGGLADFNNQIGETNEGDNNYNVLTLTITPPLQNLTEVVTALTSTTVPAGTSFSFATNTVNIGQNTAAGSTARIYISSDPFITAQDTLLATHVSGPLGSGAGSAQNFAVNLPGNLAPGTWYIGGLADYFNQVSESNEGDNNRNLLTINVTAPPGPNLTEVVTALTNTTVTPGGMFSFAATAANGGTLAAVASTSRIFLSSDPIITGADTVLAIQSVGSLAVGATQAQNYQVQIPGNLTPGTYYVGGLADFYNQVGETNESDNNNNLVALTVLPSNLTETLTALQSTTIPAGGTTSFSWSARASNSGTGNSFASTSGMYLSTDPTITRSDYLLGIEYVPILTPGATFAMNFSANNLPANLVPGTYYIGGLADIYDQVPESNEDDNNNNYIQITLTGPNLRSSVSPVSSTTANTGGTFTFTVHTTNNGNGNASSSSTHIYLSTDPNVTTSDTLVAVQSVSSLSPGGDAGQNFTVTLPSNIGPGTYYLAAIADATGTNLESDETDNVSNIVTLTLQPPPFSINFNYSGDPSYLQYITAAGNRWSQVITGDLPDINGIDDLSIDINFAPIDGAFGITAQGGFDRQRPNDGLPYHGSITFDTADVSRLISNGTFTSVAIHEIGHVLGIGTLWDSNHRNLIGNNFDYYGAQALANYRQLSGNPNAAYVPIEDTGGPGSVNSHWRESIFGSELMTSASPNSLPIPLSVLTIAALQDLGYQVNYGAADPYSLPGHLVAGSEVAQAASDPIDDPFSGMNAANMLLANGIANQFAQDCVCFGSSSSVEPGPNIGATVVASSPDLSKTSFVTHT